MKLSTTFRSLLLGIGISIAGNVFAQDAQIAFYNGNDLMNTNIKKYTTKNIGDNLRYEQENFVRPDKLAFFPNDISPSLSTPKDWVFFQGLKSPYSNKWIYMERTEIGTEFSVWLYDANSGKKVLLVNQKTTPQENYSFKPIAWSADKSVFYLEMLKFNTDLDNEGIWKYDLKTNQMSKLSISKNYFTTPMISPDRNYFLYLNSNEADRDLLHGYADEIRIYNIKQQKEKSTYKKEGTPLQLVGWITEKNNGKDIKVHKISPEQTKEEHTVSAVNYLLPWDSGRAYYVSRHGSPAPTGSHSPTGSRSSIYDGIGQHGYPAIDFDTPDNADQTLRAAAAGTVTSAGNCNCAYGNLVIIRHSDGTRTYYAHLKSVWVSSGQSVNQGTVLGTEGTTGRSSGDHLHFEWRAAGGNSSTLGTFDDVGQPRQGYKYTAGSSAPPPPPPPPVGDTTPPTTSITAPNSATDNFTVTFTDDDNVGVVRRFYQVLESVNNEWRGNKIKGFYNDNFGDLSIHSDYTKGLDDWEGTWWETSEGRLRQSSLNSNTAMSTELSQTQGNAYLYNFAAKVNNTSGNRRFGMHIMASSQTQRERGNSYLIWFATDANKVYIYETINNVLYNRADATLSTDNSWADYKIAYSTNSGKIEVFKNGTPVLDWTDASPLTSGSYMSFRTNGASVDFDDLKVFKSRGTSQTVFVGSTDWNDVRVTGSPAAKIKSLVKDAANNWSSLGDAEVNISNISAKIATNLEDEEQISELSLYPNPISDSRLNVVYSLKESSDVNIRLYNVLGEEISILYEGNKDAGTQKQEFELSNLRLKAGTYIVRISTNEGTKTLRLVKL